MPRKTMTAIRLESMQNQRDAHLAKRDEHDRMAIGHEQKARELDRQIEDLKDLTEPVRAVTSRVGPRSGEPLGDGDAWARLRVDDAMRDASI